MTSACNRDGCDGLAIFSAPLELRADHLAIRFRLLLCADHAEEMPWLVRLREQRDWNCGLLLSLPLEEEVV